MTEEKIPDYLYHYTKIDTLQHMFKSGGEVEIRLTDYRFLNDAEEGQFLGKFFKKNRKSYHDKLKGKDLKDFFNVCADIMSVGVDEIQKDGHNVYIMSFTELDDSMQFWRQDYAKDKGLCLRLKTSKFKVPNNYENSTLDANKKKLFFKVQYIGINDNIEDAFPNLEQSLQDTLKIYSKKIYPINVNGIFYISEVDLPSNFNIKNKVWKSEAEWRFKILQFHDESTMKGIKAHYEIDNFGIPRATITIENPFDEIILGPSFSTPYKTSIEKWLCKRGFKDINVRCGDGVLND